MYCTRYYAKYLFQLLHNVATNISCKLIIAFQSVNDVRFFSVERSPFKLFAFLSCSTSVSVPLLPVGLFMYTYLHFGTNLELKLPLLPLARAYSFSHVVSMPSFLSSCCFCLWCCARRPKMWVIQGHVSIDQCSRREQASCCVTERASLG